MKPTTHRRSNRLRPKSQHQHDNIPTATRTRAELTRRLRLSNTRESPYRCEHCILHITMTVNGPSNSNLSACHRIQILQHSVDWPIRRYSRPHNILESGFEHPLLQRSPPASRKPQISQPSGDLVFVMRRPFDVLVFPQDRSLLTERAQRVVAMFSEPGLRQVFDRAPVLE